jgi:monoamine oxidase
MTTPSSGTSDQLNQHYDYAIVGGGVSGLYTAWRLLGRDSGKSGKSVAVFEQGDRIGGRLLTWNPRGDKAGLRAELGGMRFFEEQQLVWNLIKELKLSDQRIKFYTDGKKQDDPDYPGLTWYLRGLRMAAQDGKSASTRYLLNDTEKGKSSAVLLTDAIKKVLNENGITRPPTTREGWDKIKPKLEYGGRELWKLGFWNLLFDLLSAEAYRYIVDSFGYYTLALNWNAAEALQNVWLDFVDHAPYMTLSKGFDQLTKTLCTAIQKDATQKRVFINTQLVGFDVKGNRITLRLHVKEGSQAGVQQITADHLILAMPQRSLALLEPSGEWNLRTNPKLRERVTSVRAYPAFKLFLFYDNRWWNDKGFDKKPIHHGRSVCDLPIRQTYYLRPDSCEKTGSSCPDYGLLMASYDDSVAVDFWRGLEPTDREKTALDNEFVKTVMTSLEALGLDDALPPPLLLHGAPPDMIRHAHQQLAELHGITVDKIPEPKHAAYADWSLDPFGGGWHFWEPQVKVENVMPQIRKPLDDKNVYVIGEAYSGYQGWVEGALTTAELVLNNHLAVPKASWIKDYYLGW